MKFDISISAAYLVFAVKIYASVYSAFIKFVCADAFLRLVCKIAIYIGNYRANKNIFVEASILFQRFFYFWNPRRDVYWDDCKKRKNISKRRSIIIKISIGATNVVIVINVAYFLTTFLHSFCFCVTAAMASLIFGFLISKKLGLDKDRLAARGYA